MVFCHFGNNYISITRFTPDNLKYLIHENTPPNILKNMNSYIKAWLRPRKETS